MSKHVRDLESRKCAHVSAKQWPQACLVAQELAGRYLEKGQHQQALQEYQQICQWYSLLENKLETAKTYR